MGMVTARWGDSGQELLRKSAQISLAIIGSGDAGRGGALDSGQGSFVGLNPPDGADEIGQRAGLVKKSSALVIDQFGNPGDRRRQHELFVSHGLHQDYRDSFAPAGHDDQVGVAVVAGKISARHVTDQGNAPLEPQRHNLAFESRALRPLTDDPAEKVETLVAKRGAGLDEKAIVLYPMQAADGEETELPVAGLGCGYGPGKHAIDSKALHDDFLRGRGRVVAENVMPIQVGDGYTELASAQFVRQHIDALHQIR